MAAETEIPESRREIPESRRGEVPESRRGDRGEAIITRVLDATVEELAAVGCAAFKLERVAERAQVNRTTIFRRWPTKSDLIQAAITRASTQVDFAVDTGSLRGDLRVLVESSLAVSTAVSLVRVSLEGEDMPEIHQLSRELSAAKQQQASAMIERWASRGELRPSLDKSLFLESVMGVIYLRSALSRQKPVEAERLVDYFCEIASPRRVERMAGAWE